MKKANKLKNMKCYYENCGNKVEHPEREDWYGLCDVCVAVVQTNSDKQKYCTSCGYVEAQFVGKCQECGQQLNSVI